MKYEILENVFRKNIPSYDEFPENKKKIVLRNFLNENLEKILLKIKLPDPIKLKMEMIREKYLDNRRPKGHKRGEWKINYNLWRFLFEAKSKMNFNIAQDSLFEEQSYNGQTTIIKPKSGFFNTSSWIPSESTSSTSLTLGNKSLIQFKVQPKLEEKVIHSKEYAEFVKCLDTTCRTNTIEMKNVEYYLHETIDIENPGWEKIVLDIKFEEEDFEYKLEKWEKIRDKIDASISRLKKEKPLLTEIIKLEKKLFINMVF